MLQALIGPVANLAGSWLQGKADKNAAAAELKLTEAKAKAQILLSEKTSVADWERIMAEGAKSSWKDEWFVIVLSIPMVGAFIPSMVPHMQEGFVVLGSMPDYYKGFLGAAIGASFGIKALSKWK